MLFLLLQALAGLALAKGTGSTIRGLNPDLASHYNGAGGTFKCIGAQKTIPFSRVNDDYCDCPDGSDEPGTAACYNGRFFCQNLGHEPQLLAASFVDDGVCDCCDGTDEVKGKCKNTCLEANAVHKEALRSKIAQYEVALATKAGYVNKAQSFKAELQLKANTVADDIVRQQQEVERIQAEVTQLEAEEAAGKAEEARLAAEQQAAADAAAQEQAGAAADGAADAAADGSNLDAGAGTQEQRELHEEAAAEEPQVHIEETPEERGRRIASQWTNDPEAAGAPADGSQAGLVVEEHTSSDGAEDHTDYQGHHGEHEHDGTDHEYDGTEHGDHEYEHHNHAAGTLTPLAEARNKLYAAQRVLRDLEKDQSNIVTYLHSNLDYGPDDLFLAFAEQCFSSYQTRWTYEVCPFKQAIQKEGYTNSVTVGRWQGFSPDYKQMLFGGGDECWNVGPRTMTVSMSCGNENKLSDGEEPATCQYVTKLTTPALCNEAELAELRQQLANVEAFERAVAELIAKDEL